MSWSPSLLLEQHREGIASWQQAFRFFLRFLLICMIWLIMIHCIERNLIVECSSYVSPTHTLCNTGHAQSSNILWVWVIYGRECCKVHLSFLQYHPQQPCVRKYFR